MQTEQCRRVTALLSDNEQDMVYFGGNSTQYSEQYIRQRLEESAAADKTPLEKQGFTLSSYQVSILELEWLMGNVDHFFT